MNRRKHGRVAASLLGASVGLMLGSSALAADFNIKFAGGEPTKGPMNSLMKEFKKCIEPASGGKIAVQLFPGSQLGGVGSHIQGMQNGTIEMSTFATQHLKGVDKRFGIVDAPGLLNSFEHANATYWDPGFRDKYLQAAQDKGVLGISMLAYGPTSFQTVKPMRTLEDFRGKKFRILASDVEKKEMDALGAAGLQVEVPDFVPAMQRGQIDGLHSNISLAAAYKWYTAAKYATLTNESMIPIGAFISTKFFDKLPADLQQKVRDCGTEAQHNAAPVAVETDANAQAAWKAAGAEIIHLSKDDQAKLTKMAVDIGDSIYLEDPETKEMFEALKAAAARTAK
ncbi:MAG: TRAP transporter substrate-binding protein [Burkholderiaceae bacterium]